MRMRFLAALLLASVLGTSASAEILTLFSDNGIPQSPARTIDAYGCTLTWGACGAPETFDGASLDRVPPEGLSSWKTASTFPGPTEYAGWGVHYTQPQNLGRFYANGELRFWIYSTTPFVKLGINHQTGIAMPELALNVPVNQWVHRRIKFTDYILNESLMGAIVNPFLFTSYNGANTFYIDNVRYVDSATSPIFSVRLCNMGDTACVTSPPEITWSNSASSWRVADQYIQLTLDSDSTLWGVQIYTNNRAGSANPQYIVNGSSNPVGLVNTTQRRLTVPLAWSIKAGTQPVAAVTPTAAEPNNGADLNSFQWIYMKDALTPNIPQDNTTAFVPGELPVTVKNNVGIHYGQQNTDFGAETPPNYIFLEADFGKALAQHTYRTNTLTLEFFNL